MTTDLPGEVEVQVTSQVRLMYRADRRKRDAFLDHILAYDSRFRPAQPAFARRFSGLVGTRRAEGAVGTLRQVQRAVRPRLQPRATLRRQGWRDRMRRTCFDRNVPPIAWRSHVNLFRRGLIASTLLAGLTSPGHAQRGPVAAALMQFEAAVTWEAVSADWRGIRPGWLQQVAAAFNPTEVSTLMMHLEAAMTWEAVRPEWRDRRAGWLAEAQAARAPAEVARLLLELEEVTLWSAVDGSWRETRPGWVAQLSAVSGSAGRPSK
ncbi:MAG: hypothetical protein H7X89_10765 [Rhizobiales bacterium]|nr:hypothetical protein [Hyphomicrobiales bacterium]